MKDITNTKLEVYASKRLDVIYTSEGKSVPYAKVELGVVKNPFTDQIEVAIRPLVKNAFGELFPLYSYEEDLQYQYCMKVASDCLINNLAIPEDVDKFARALMQKKEFARKQADEYVSKQLQKPLEKVSTAYTRSEWREDIAQCVQVKELLEEYYKSIKK